MPRKSIDKRKKDGYNEKRKALWLCPAITGGEIKGSEVIMPAKIVELYQKYKEVFWYLVFGVLTTLVNFITYYPLRFLGVHIYDWKTMRRDSFDGGETFSPPSELVPGDASGGRGPVKNKPILLSDGAILAPASHESADERWRAFADRSDDGGRTFTVSAYFATADASVKLIQPSFWEDKNGVHAFIRSDQGVIYRADSADLGRTWGMAYPTALPNNNAGLDLARLPDGRLLLASNPVGENWGKRTPLTLSVSEDGGSTFRRLLDLETEDDPASPRSARYEFSYPAVLADGQRVYITYTHRRERIAYAILGE